MTSAQDAAGPESVLGIAAAIRAGEVSPVEIVERALARIEALNPTLNAFVHVAAAAARISAREAEARVVRGEARPLEGVPVAIKDDTYVAGMPTSEGSRMVGDELAERDAHLVARLRDAGAILLGKTNLPEFGATAVTESLRWGAARNPWNPAYTPGGSSGGSAAAVAAGMVAAGHGDDGGGSLRIPASCCGLFTVKPTRGLLSVAPFGGESPLTVHGYLTRSVADNALLMDLTAGAVPGDQFWMPAPQHSYLDLVRTAPAQARLRIAWTASPAIDMPVHAACADAVRQAAALCADLGHHVEEFTPDWSSPSARDDFMELWTVLIGSFVYYLVEAGGVAALAEPHNREMYERARAYPAPAYLTLMASMRQVVRRALTAWQTYDLVLTPALAKPPLRVGELFAAADAPLTPMLRAFEFVPFTPIVNLTGQPAASIPFGHHAGLPVGVQIIGALGAEATVLRLSAEIEAARPWGYDLPPLTAGTANPA